MVAEIDRLLCALKGRANVCTAKRPPTLLQAIPCLFAAPAHTALRPVGCGKLGCAALLGAPGTRSSRSSDCHNTGAGLGSGHCQSMAPCLGMPQNRIDTVGARVPSLCLVCRLVVVTNARWHGPAAVCSVSSREKRKISNKQASLAFVYLSQQLVHGIGTPGARSRYSRAT